MCNESDVAACNGALTSHYYFWDPAGSPAPANHDSAYVPEVNEGHGEVRQRTLDILSAETACTSMGYVIMLMCLALTVLSIHSINTHSIGLMLMLPMIQQFWHACHYAFDELLGSCLKSLWTHRRKLPMLTRKPRDPRPAKFVGSQRYRVKGKAVKLSSTRRLYGTIRYWAHCMLFAIMLWAFTLAYVSRIASGCDPPNRAFRLCK